MLGAVHDDWLLREFLMTMCDNIWGAHKFIEVNDIKQVIDIDKSNHHDKTSFIVTNKKMAWGAHSRTGNVESHRYRHKN